MKSEKLSRIYQNAPYETRLMMSLLEEVVGVDKVEKVLDELEAPDATKDVMIAGKPLRYFSGMSEESIDKLLSKEEKEIYYTYFEKPVSEKEEEASPKEEVEEEVPKKSSK